MAQVVYLPSGTIEAGEILYGTGNDVSECISFTYKRYKMLREYFSLSRLKWANGNTKDVVRLIKTICQLILPMDSESLPHWNDTLVYELELHSSGTKEEKEFIEGVKKLSVIETVMFYDEIKEIGPSLLAKVAKKER